MSLWRNFRLLCASFIGAAFVVALAFAFTAPASAAINRELSYQAKLLDNSGLPVADGTYSVKFSLYDAATLGNRLWTASGTLSVPTAIQVTVTNGLFTVYLGDTSFQGQNSLDDSINWNSANLYLGVTINADSEMTPRRQLTASPYAFNANQVQGMSPSSSAFGASSVFAINQTSNTAATGTRTALEVRSQGTSNTNDFLIRAINDLGSAVFSVNRQGAVTSSGLLVGLGGVSTTNLTVNTVNGQAPCLADGSNCPSGNATQTLQQVTNAGNSTTNTIQFAGGTSTGNFAFQQGVTWTNATGTNTTSTNFSATNLTASNGTITNLTATNATSGWLGFTTASGTTLTALNLNSNNVNIVGGAINGTVIGNITPASGVFTNATATTFFATYSSTTNSTSTNLASVSAIFTNLNTTNATATNLVTSNSTSTNFAVTGLTTSTFNAGVSANAGSFTSYVMVGGQLVCLANGTNCSAASGTVGTLQQVTNAGNSTTNTIQFAGGTSTADFAVQGTLTVNNLSLASLTVPASLTALSSTATGFTPSQTLVRGDYLYMMESGNQQLAIYDISNPSSPSRIFFTSSGAGGRAMDLLGDQLLVAGDYPNSLRIFDVSNPRNPVRLQATTAGPSGNTRVVSQGNFAYLMGSGGNNFVTMDVSNPNIVRGVATTTLTGSLAGGFDTDGRYVYYNSPGTFGIVDVRVPAAPVEVFATSTGSLAGRDLAIQGRYAYVTDVSSNNVGIYDVASSTSPTLVATINTGSAVSDDYALEVAGKYLFIGDAAGIKVYDISTPASPSLATSIALAGAHGLSLSGRTLAALGSDNTLRLYDIGGANFGGVLADSASIGDLSVRDRVNVGSDVAVRGSVTIGEGGLFSQGAINVSGSSTTSTIQGSLNVVRGLSVNGTSVCLSDGTNCQSGGGSTGTLQTITNAGNTTTNAIQFAGGTSTGNFAVQGTLTATNGSFSNATSSWLGFTTASGTTLTALNLNANNATILGGTATLSSLTVTNTSTFNGTFASSSVVGNVTTTNSPFVPEASSNILFSSVISGGDVNTDGYGALYVTGTAYFGGNTFITHFDAGTSTVKGLTASDLNVTQGLTSASNTLGTIIANNITVTNTTSSWLGFMTASGTTLTALNLNANNAVIIDGTANLTDLTWTNATGINTTTTNFYVSNDLTSDATATFRNDVVLGSNPASLITVNGSFASSLVPNSQFAYNVGNPGLEWSSVYALNGIFGNGSTAVSLFDNGLNVVSGDFNIGVGGGYFAPFTDLGVTLGSSTQRFNANFGSVTATSLALTPVSSGGNPLVVSSTTYGPPVDLVVKDHYAYVLTNDNALHIFDVSNQNGVIQMASTTVGANPIKVAVQGDYLYITSFFGGTLETYNISDKNNPILVSTISSLTGAKNISVYGSYLYLARTDNLDIYDIHEGVPKLVYTNSDTAINNFAFEGRTLYIGHSSGGGSLAMYDIRNPASPVLLGFVNAGSVQGLDVQGSYAYVNDNGPNPDIVRIYNVGNPASASFVGQTGFTHNFGGDNRIFVAGKYAYACDDGAFSTIDVSDPAAPVEVNFQGTDVGLVCYLSGNYMYAAGGFANSLKVYRLQGLNVIGLGASAAEFGTLAVQNNADFADNIRVGRGIEVGSEGITSLGGLNVMTTNTTSTLLGNVLIGTSTQAIGLHSLFTMNGDDLLVAGNIGSASSIYTNGAFVAGTGTTMYASNFISSYGAPFEVETNGYGMVVKGGITSQMTATSSLSFVTSTGALTDPRNLVKQGDYAYVLDYLGSQLSIFDVRNPVSAKEVGTISSLFNPVSIVVDGKYAFITRSTSPDLVAVDISNPSSPSFAGSLSAGFSTPWAIASAGKYLYITDVGSGSLKVVDRSNPWSLRIVSSTEPILANAADIKIKDRYAYVADSSNGAIKVYDLVDPVNPQLVTSTVVGIFPVSLDIKGNYLYSADSSSNNVTILDISNPSIPQVVYDIANGTSPDHVIAQGNYLYVTNYIAGSITIYDVTDPTNPRSIGAYSTGIDNPRALVGDGNKLYIADAGLGKLVILARPGLDIASADIGSARLGDLSVSGNAIISQDVNVNGSLHVGLQGITTQGTLTADGSATFNGNINNLLAANHSELEKVSVINFPSNFDRGRFIAFKGNTAYVLTRSSNQLLAYDIRDAKNPRLISNTALSAQPMLMQISGNYGFIGYNSGEIDIFDLTKSNSPTLLSTKNTGFFQDITGLQVVGSRLYVTNANYFWIYDVSDPARLRELGHIAFAGTVGRLAVSGNYAYVNEGLTINVIDVTKAENATIVGTYVTATPFMTGVNDMKIQDRELYVHYFGGQLEAIDVSNPSSPVLDGALTISWGGASTAGIDIKGRYAVVSTGFAQVQIADIHNPLNMQIVKTINTGIWNTYNPRFYGNNLYLPDNSGFIGQLEIYRMPSIETVAIQGSLADIANLTVRDDAQVNNKLSVGSAVDVGVGGIQSQGMISGQDGIHLELSYGSSFPLVSTTTLPDIGGYGKTLKVGKYLFEADYAYNALRVFDVSNPHKTTLVTSTSSASVLVGPWKLATNGRYLYVGMWSTPQITVYDLNDIKNPINYVGTFSSGNNGGAGLAAVGNLLYRQGDAGTLEVINAEDPSNMMVVNTISLTGSGWTDYGALKVSGKYLYGVNEGAGRLYIVSIANPEHPVEVGTLSLGVSPRSLAIKDGYAFVTDSVFLRAYDVRNPSSPSLVSTISVGNPGDPVISGNQLYVPGYLASAFSVYDITDPAEMVFIRDQVTPSASYDGLAVDGQHLYAFNTNSRLEVYRLPGLEAPGLRVGSGDFGALNVRQSMTADSDLTVRGNLMVGSSLGVDGALRLSTNSTNTPAAVFVNKAANNSTNAQAWGLRTNRLLVSENPTSTDTLGIFDAQQIIEYTSTTQIGLCVDAINNAGTCVFGTGISIAADGTINANAFDLAEYYATSTVVAPGDVLSWDTSASATVRLSTGTPYDRHVAGIVSTSPGFSLGNITSGTVVALSGRVPTKVSGQNGEIHVGDPLTTSNVPGYAMKATKPGMIIGYALEDAAATSTIEVFVKVGWNDNGLFAMNASGTQSFINDNLTVGASSAVSSTNLLADSWGVTFRGDAYDLATSSTVSQGFNLFTDILSTTSSQFTIASASGTNLLAMNQSGDLMLSGKLFPSRKGGGMQSDSYIFLDDTLGPGTSTYIATNAAGWQANDSYDFAERYYSPDVLDAGDLVTMSLTGRIHVQRTWSPGQTIMGIVSTRPAFVAGAPATSTYPIALSGRVPTKVSAQNGQVQIGDPLTASSIPGVAIKATGPGPIVGYALENATNTDISKIEVFVNPGWWGTASATQTTVIQQISTPVTVTSTEFARQHQGFANITTGMTRVNVTFPSLGAFPNIQVNPRGQVVGGFYTDNYTDTGFTIYLNQAQSRDVTFSWLAVATQTNDPIFQSNGTYGTVDSLSGMLVPGTETTTTVETVTSTAPVIPVATSTTPIIESTPSSTEPIVTTSTEPIVTTSTEPTIPVEEPIAPSSTEPVTP